MGLSILVNSLLGLRVALLSAAYSESETCISLYYRIKSLKRPDLVLVICCLEGLVMYIRNGVISYQLWP